MRIYNAVWVMETDVDRDTNTKFDRLLAAMALLANERNHQPIEHQLRNVTHVVAILKLARHFGRCFALR